MTKDTFTIKEFEAHSLAITMTKDKQLLEGKAEQVQVS